MKKEKEKKRNYLSRAENTGEKKKIMDGWFMGKKHDLTDEI